MEKIADDLMGIAHGPFIILIGVYDPGGEGGKVFLDIVKYYLSHLLRAGVAQNKVPFRKRLLELAGRAGDLSSFIPRDEAEPYVFMNGWPRGLRVVVAGGGGNGGGVVRRGRDIVFWG